MTGVTAFSGMIPASPGRMQMKLQSRAMAPPVSMVTGSRELWLEVPSMRRAMCGTASPIKEIGPQKAVVVAVSNPVATSSRLRRKREAAAKILLQSFPFPKSCRNAPLLPWRKS